MESTHDAALFQPLRSDQHTPKHTHAQTGYGSSSARESGHGYGDVFCEGGHLEEREVIVLIEGTEEEERAQLEASGKRCWVTSPPS